MNQTRGPSNLETEASLRHALVSAKYRVTVPRLHAQTGVDIVATKGSVAFHIEVIGYK
jgi:hypothetical protein